MNNKALADRVCLYEEGKLDEQETIKLFQELVDTGLAWKLQGQYGRVAQMLIEAELVTPLTSSRSLVNKTT